MPIKSYSYMCASGRGLSTSTDLADEGTLMQPDTLMWLEQ